MLVNKRDNNTANVKFVEYTGKWPNLCRGILTLEINGEQVRFGHDYTTLDSWKTDGNYAKFWSSGGTCSVRCGTEKAEWEIDVDKLPEQYQCYAAEIDEVFIPLYLS